MSKFSITYFGQEMDLFGLWGRGVTSGLVAIGPHEKDTFNLEGAEVRFNGEKTKVKQHGEIEE